MDIIRKYFPGLTAVQLEQLSRLPALYSEWNSKINVVSRKDIDNIVEHHLLHSLSIAKLLTPESGTRILDLGTGGGFPGIPLAIIWPDCRFHLIDRIGKKLKVAADIAQRTGLTNVTFQHGDIGECRERFNYVVSRAVMRLDAMLPLIRKNILHERHRGLPDGLICLKGGDIADEVAAARTSVLQIPLSDYFAEPYFKEKYIVYAEL